tara:strand:+ start:7539 stop:8519 length:981 start_codon:yes stop_codon:yes gene_type:complete
VERISFVGKFFLNKGHIIKNNFFIKFIKLLFPSISLAQALFQGSVSFEYTGTISGSFNTISADSVFTSFALNQMGTDSSLVLIGAISDQGENKFDLFLCILQDTVFPVQPRTWDIPGEGDQNNPLTLESILVLVPNIDSIFVSDLFSVFTDSLINDISSLDTLFEDFFQEFSSNFYLGYSGQIEIDHTSDSTLSGLFQTSFLKPAFYFPPHMINVNNGVFNFVSLATPILKTNIESESFNTSFLYPAYPNPFNPTTTIDFSLKSNGKLKIDIIDIRGRLIETLINQDFVKGDHKIIWNARGFSSGLYFVVLHFDHYIQTTKLVLIK